MIKRDKNTIFYDGSDKPKAETKIAAKNGQIGALLGLNIPKKMCYYVLRQEAESRREGRKEIKRAALEKRALLEGSSLSLHIPCILFHLAFFPKHSSTSSKLIPFIQFGFLR
ncbi:MAG: hypothetical protein RMK18_12065 [Armatimonadota bacterium]|nr:hypothetical protein [Armatimonadota bacterium]MDW8026581.1 hypothetical protein [Armatimonadota bacterium]